MLIQIVNINPIRAFFKIQPEVNAPSLWKVAKCWNVPGFLHNVVNSCLSYKRQEGNMVLVER